MNQDIYNLWPLWCRLLPLMHHNQIFIITSFRTRQRILYNEKSPSEYKTIPNSLKVFKSSKQNINNYTVPEYISRESSHMSTNPYNIFFLFATLSTDIGLKTDNLSQIARHCGMACFQIYH